MKEKYRTFLTALEFDLPFTEYHRRNEANRIGGASRCFDSFPDCLGESSRVILNKSPIYIIFRYFFTFTAQKMSIGNRLAEEHLNNP